jgi:hypothetical protein
MSQQPKGGINWTIVAVALSLAVQLLVGGRWSGSIEKQVENAVTRLDARDAKDTMQDFRLNAVENRTSVIENDVEAIKEGRYEPPSKRVPVFSRKGTTVQ